MRVSTRAEVEVERPIEEVFDFATACDGFQLFLFTVGPIPGVAGSRMVDAPAPKAGAKRDVRLTDGTTIHEVLLAYDRPSRHHYRWLKPPAPPFSWLVKCGEGDWTFSATQKGTRIVWLYHFDLTSPLARVLSPALLWFFRRWMQTGLERLPAALAVPP